MREDSQDAISVLFYYDGAQHYARPVRLSWHGDEYELGPVQFWHTTSQNGVTLHHYTLSDKKRQHVFRLVLETDNLTWQLEAHSDHYPVSVQPLPRLVGVLS
jgi:hypothetical protein